MPLRAIQRGAFATHHGLYGGSPIKTQLGAGFSSSRIQIASNSSLQTGDIDFSAGCWVYMNSVAAAATILAKWKTSTLDREYRLFHNMTTFALTVSQTGAATTATLTATGTNNTTGVWYFVMVWHDAINDEIGIRVNTTNTSTAYSSGVFAGTADFVIGSLENGTQPLDGRVDSAFFTKEVVSDANRTYLYNAGAGRVYSDLVTAGSALLTPMISWWDLAQATGATQLDAKSSNNLAVGTGTVSSVAGVAFGYEFQ